MSEPQPSPRSLRELIDAFIKNRFVTKIEKLAVDEPAYLKLQQQFEPQTWLADASVSFRSSPIRSRQFTPTPGAPTSM